MPLPPVVFRSKYIAEHALSPVYARGGILGRTLTPAKQRAQYRLNAEAERLQFEEQATAPCKDNPGPWMDFESPDEPAVFQAQVSCGGCRFLEVCRERARLERPEHGVFAAEVWVDGKIVRRARRAQQRAYEEAVGHLA